MYGGNLVVTAAGTNNPLYSAATGWQSYSGGNVGHYTGSNLDSMVSGGVPPFTGRVQ